MNSELLKYPLHQTLDLDMFKQMDYRAIEKFKIPIELMMENAGYHLARLIAISVQRDAKIVIGVGKGNNGGGGLVAARRLAAWGYAVHLDIPFGITAPLPKLQLERAVAVGAQQAVCTNPTTWIDAYFGFSQRLPMPGAMVERFSRINSLPILKISLDIPSGVSNEITEPYFRADKVLCLAAPKKMLYPLRNTTDFYLADIGIPASMYDAFRLPQPPFYRDGVLKWNFE